VCVFLFVNTCTSAKLKKEKDLEVPTVEIETKSYKLIVSS
jgi:hypothetical protein